MADEAINLTLSSSSQESPRQRREKEWKATYARIGQEPPPMPEEEYDGRSLYEKLKEKKDKKQEAFEEQLKFKNQFRALDDDEVAFLDDAAEEKRLAELLKEREIQKEMELFKKAVAARSVESTSVLTSSFPIKDLVQDDNNKPASSPKTIANTTMIPKKTRKSKDFQRAFLAGAIRPKAAPANLSSCPKKRKSSSTSTSSEMNNNNNNDNLSSPAVETSSYHKIQQEGHQPETKKPKVEV
ncbi:hypothetical protein O181_084836 [Austropuccinia psidii MF-1]|uniref:FAM192A/Fyv6 N-terminal domain-containing protein n=1 Tax=Austropuccinia psidii MF-1 TaxID=1389203 RepID=A0A9Q3FX92_9BASI|nr:hypothetical protein [Austropuccinia psidii MF-1]